MGGRGGSGGYVTLERRLGLGRGERLGLGDASGPPAKYPALSNGAALPLLPGEPWAELGSAHAQIVAAFRHSPYHLPSTSLNVHIPTIARYTDKYKLRSSQSFQPNPALVPAELLPQRGGAALKKRRKAVGGKGAVESRLAALEASEAAVESGVGGEESTRKPGEEEGGAGSGEEDGGRGNASMEEEGDGRPLSDAEDYAEEDNDYATNYFDNGEGFGAQNDSGDNLDEDNVF